MISNGGKIAFNINKNFTKITTCIDLKVNKISHRGKLANMLDRFENQKSVQRIRLNNFFSKSTLDF